MKLHLLLFLPILFGCDNGNDIVNIPDANFKIYLVGNTAINTNGDKEIQVSEASTFTDAIDLFDLNISNLKGIEAFTALTKLDCSDNQLTSLDVSKNTALTYLDCGKNQLTSLNIYNNEALSTLSCEHNQFDCEPLIERVLQLHPW